MVKESKETLLFEKYLRRVNKVLGVLGLSLDENDMDKSLAQRLRSRLFFCFNCIWLNNDVILEFAWLIDSLLIGRSVIEITYFIPCLTLCILGDLKAFYFVLHAREANDVVKTLRKLQAMSKETRSYRESVEEEMNKKQIPMLNFATISLWATNTFGLITFAIGPLVITAINYKQTGIFELGLPFLLWYPFNSSDVRIWPFAYIHQLWSAINAVLTVVGPDNYFSLCCTFTHMQFRNLQYDIESISIQQVDRNNITIDTNFHAQLIQIIERHRELIRGILFTLSCGSDVTKKLVICSVIVLGLRQFTEESRHHIREAFARPICHYQVYCCYSCCVEMLETIFTKSTLFNVATSSLLICITGFNVTTIDNYVLMVPFIGFLLMGLFQIYVFCYYGDLIMKSSTDIGNAVYNSLWYTGNAATMRDMLFISMRSRRPCKLTAYGFAEINLSTFCRIMSTAWSYFALLKTVYK